MEFQNVVESAGTCRYFTREPMPDEMLSQLINAARFAPTGANRQGVRFLVVTDPSKRRALGDRYLDAWRVTLEQVLPIDADVATLPRVVRDADHFARHFGEIPVLVVVCALLEDLLPTDTGLDRLSVVGGASIYPAVQNLLLKCRDVGLGAALTTNLCQYEPEIKDLLGIPDGVATAATIAIGFPAKPFPQVLSRRPWNEIAYLNTYGEPIEPSVIAAP